MEDQQNAVPELVGVKRRDSMVIELSCSVKNRLLVYCFIFSFSLERLFLRFAGGTVGRPRP